MKNFTAPLNEYHTLRQFFFKNPITKVTLNQIFKYDYTVQSAEFTDNSDTLGLFETQAEPVKFFMESDASGYAVHKNETASR